MNRSRPRSAIPAAALLIFLSGPALAEAQRASLVGYVADTSGVPLAGARITLLELRRSALSDARGEFRIAALPAGAFAVSIARLGHAPEVRRVVLSDTLHHLVVRLRAVGVTMSTVQVTATPGATLARESPQPVAVLEAA